jgi:hypothetical protein
VSVVTVRRERREDARILVDKHSLWALRCGREARCVEGREGTIQGELEGGLAGTPEEVPR